MTNSDRNHFSVSARWIFPVSSPPLEHGVVEIQSGRIVAVHNRPDARTIDLGNVALLPGLVNAHTHLEFSDLQHPVEPALPFTDWIKSLVGVRRATPATADVIQAGLSECAQHGTTQVGEIATQDWPLETYCQPHIRTIVFRELLGLLPDRAATQLEIARQWLDGANAPDDSITRGLSPHAPYTVHPDLYRDLVKLAAEKNAPIAIHLAETQAELELLHRGTGEFVEMLQRFNAWDPRLIPRRTRPLDYLRPLSAVSRGLVVHGNYLDSNEIDWLQQHPQVSVVYCPRTHAFFQHLPHPWQELLNRGVNVALGTDSRGSNPDLSLWREMRFLAKHFPNHDPADILTMGTQSGALALGREIDSGTLDPGKRADFTIVPLPATDDMTPYQLLFSGTDALPFRLP